MIEAGLHPTAEQVAANMRALEAHSGKLESHKAQLATQRLEGQVLAYHALERKQEADAVLAALIAKHQNDAAYQIAEVYACRGESDKSFAWLERA